MDGLFIQNAMALVVFGFIGVAVAWGLSRLMDRAARTSFKHEALPMILADSRAAGIYYGLRWAGTCVLVGWLFSRFV